MSASARLFGLLSPLLLMLTGCNPDLPMSTINPKSDLAWIIHDIYVDIFWWTLAIFIVVQGVLLYVVFRFREKPGDTSLPEQVHGNLRMEIGWTLLPVVILVLIAVPTIKAIFVTQTAPEGEVLNVTVKGEQWWWEFEYPDLGVVTANELHLPVDKTVYLRLQSDNVLHAFWVPLLGGKRDLIPGRHNYIWLTPQEVGTFVGQCAELCGDSHGLMRMRAIVQTQEDFDAWVEKQLEPAAEPLGALAAKGAETFMQTGCIACHRINGTMAQGKLGPDLTHVASRTHIVSDIFENTPENMAAWLRDPPALKPGSLMLNLNLNEEQISELVAYLATLE